METIATTAKGEAMSIAKQDRIIAAIVRHERAQQEIKSIKASIAESIAKCPISIEAEKDSRLFDEKYRTKTHLWEALNEVVEIDAWGCTRRLNSDEIDEYLHCSECKHCMHAWELIIKRKSARQELGSAKRAIRNIGRALLKDEVKP